MHGWHAQAAVLKQQKWQFLLDGIANVTSILFTQLLFQILIVLDPITAMLELLAFAHTIGSHCKPSFQLK